MNTQHKELAAGRWQKLSFIEQMANIGSEVERALNWKSKNNADYSRLAVERALELLGLTIDCSKNLSRTKELTRARESILDYFWGSNQYMSTESSWKKYFAHFTYAARKNS
jgi:hypothetical protein